MKHLFSVVLLALSVILSVNLLLNSCKKEIATADNNFYQANSLVNDRSANSFSVEVTDNVGNCFVVSIEKNQDNTVYYRKIPVACAPNTSVKKGLWVFVNHSISNGELTFPPNNNYWYIPLDDNLSPQRVGGGNYKCFCEGGLLDDPLCDPNLGPPSCEIDEYSNPFVTIVSCNSICCSDCDLLYCPCLGNPLPSPVGNGIIIEADSVVIQSVGANTSSYLGGNTRLTVVREIRVVAV